MQQINLYATLEKPNPYALNSRRASLFFFRILFLCIFLTVALGIYVSGQKIYWYFLATKQAKLTQSLESELFTTDANKPFQNYAQQMQYQEKLMQKMEKYHASIPFQPSRVLLNISTTSNADIVFTKIDIEDQGKVVTFAGQSINSLQVLNFIKDLKMKTRFKNMVFKTVSIKEDKGQVQFLISTKEKEKAAS